MGPVWQTVCLAEHELPADLCPSGVVILEIKGLCPGSRVMPHLKDPDRGKPGFLVLKRTKANGDTKVQDDEIATEFRKRAFSRSWNSVVELR